MQQLSALDNLMLEGELPNLPMHMSAIMIYDTKGKRGSARMLEMFQDRFLENTEKHFPILLCKPERLPLHLDRAYWVEDPNFSLTHHLSHVALPKSQDWAALYRLFGDFHAQPLDTSRPLWQVMYVEGLDRLEGIPRGSSALFLKIHHSVFDGKGALRLAHSFHNLSPEPDAPTLADSMPLGDEDVDFHSPSLLSRYRRAWWHSIERPIDLVATLMKIAPQLWPARGSGEAKSETPTPRTLFNNPVTADRVVGHVGMELSQLRQLEKKHHCSINDIALCVIAGALRGYLLEQDKLPAEDLRALMPIDIRSPKEDGSTGNHVTVAKISLYSSIEDTKSRLNAIHKDTSRGKKESRRSGSRALLELVDEIHPAVIISLGEWLIASGHIDDLPQPVNTVVTNVPGIADKAYIGDAELIDYLGFGPLAPNVGLFHTVSSTSDHVNISFLSTCKFVGDGAGYRDWIAQSWEDVCAL